MRSYMLIAGAAAMTLGAAPLFASDDPQFGDVQTAPIPAPQFNSALDPGNKMVCKSVARGGSRLTDRECKTAADWDKIAEAAHRGAQDMFNKPGFRQCGAGVLGPLGLGATMGGNGGSGSPESC